MMQWIPYGTTGRICKAHIRTFRAVFPHVIVVRGPAATACSCSAPTSRCRLDPRRYPRGARRPGVLEDISSAYDSPASTVEGWRRGIERQTW